MANFDEMLKALHSGADLVDEEQAIVIDRTRQFILPENFNAVIAYEGDVNSQIITFHCPKIWERHDLSSCIYKTLYWKNKNSGLEGTSPLTPGSAPTDTTQQSLLWAVPPEAFSKSGVLEISISLYDLYNGKIAFAWNTPTFSGLSVGASMQEVGYKNPNDIKARLSPARNEILLVDLERRNIIAPQGYNFTVANYGEVGVSTIHFQVNRYYKDLDINDGELTILASLNEKIYPSKIIEEYKFLIYTDESEGDGILQFDWEIPEYITANEDQYTGNFSITLIFTWPKNDKILIISEFSNLIIGGKPVPSLFPVDFERAFHIKGDGYTSAADKVEIGGIVSIRDNLTDSQENPVNLKRNELAADYDADGNYLGLKIGIVDDQRITDAPYAISPKIFEDMLTQFFNDNEIVISAEDIE